MFSQEGAHDLSEIVNNQDENRPPTQMPSNTMEVSKVDVYKYISKIHFSAHRGGYEEKSNVQLNLHFWFSLYSEDKSLS